MVSEERQSSWHQKNKGFNCRCNVKIKRLKIKMPRAQKVKTANWLCPTQKKKLSVCLQGESPIALPSLRRRSTDEQNLRLRAQNQGSALRARGLPGHNRLDRAHAVRRAVDAGRDDARVCRDGEPRAEGARAARRREGRGSRSWSRSSSL